MRGEPRVPGEVCDGTAHFQDTVVRPGRQLQPFHRRFQQLPRRGLKPAVALQLPVVHVCVAVHHVPVARKSLQLYVSCGHHAHADSFARFFRGLAGDIRRLHGRYFNVKVYPVEQRPRQFVEIALHVSRRAGTFLFRVVVVATWA